MVSTSLHYINSSTNIQLALHRYSAVEHYELEPVILAHGTFSNYRSCRGLADYLAKQGFDCWILDSQGHGFSDKPKIEPDFESMALHDVEAVFNFVSSVYKDRKFSWVGHSGGGLSALMYLARNPSSRDKILSMTTLASQATDAGLTPSNRLKIHIASWITYVCGFAPGKLAKLGPENEFAKVMQQWFDWSLTGRWLGQDKFDYLQTLQEIDTPYFSLSAANDHFIAPPTGCFKLHLAVSAKEKKYLLCGQKEGFSEDYTHARLVSSRNASKEIWPRIATWLKQYHFIQ